MVSNKILYVYPKWHTVSFTLVARKHIEYIRNIGFNDIYEMDELHIVGFTPSLGYKLVLHPGFYILHRIIETRRDIFGNYREDYYKWWRSRFEELIGIDVCDSDRYSTYAVNLANQFDKFIVPSSYCVEVAKRSGIKARIYRVPHGVDPEWYSTPNLWEIMPPEKLNPVLLKLYLLKKTKGKKLILYWLWHSADRKGWPEVYEFYKRLRRERDDVILVMKTMQPNIREYQQVMQLGAVEVYGWLTEFEKMMLFDTVDITLNFSRGGGFEINCLESLARGVPCVASDYGSWTDYVPSFLQVKRGRRVQPLPGNAIHCGWGYTVDVDSALDKVNWILDNLDDVRARTEEWRQKVLSKEYRWDLIARKLLDIILRG